MMKILKILTSVPIIMMIACAGKVMRIEGTDEEIQKQVAQYFPIGSTKEEVLETLIQKFGINREKVRSRKFEPVIEIDYNKRKYYITSWLGCSLSEYRSIKKMFMKTIVTASFDFDLEDKLIRLKVRQYHDSL